LYLSGLEKRLNDAIRNSDFDAVDSDGLPVNSIAVVVFLLVVAAAAVMFSGE
jgi:hypothetical protein